MMKKLSPLAGTLIITILCYACFSIRYDMRGADPDPNIKTMSVQYFDNRAPRIQPQLSQNFTDALRDFLERNTKIKLINDVGDIDFSGEIVGYDIAPAGIGAGDVATKTRFTIRINVSYTNSVNPDESFEEVFSRFRDFESTQSFSSVENELTEEIIEEIIEQIFNKAFVNW